MLLLRLTAVLPIRWHVPAGALLSVYASTNVQDLHNGSEEQALQQSVAPASVSFGEEARIVLW